MKVKMKQIQCTSVPQMVHTIITLCIPSSTWGTGHCSASECVIWSVEPMRLGRDSVPVRRKTIT